MQHPTETLEYGYNVVFEREKNGFRATVPAFGGLSTFAETLEEARDQVSDLIAGALARYHENGFGVPLPDKEVVTERVTVELSR